MSDCWRQENVPLFALGQKFFCFFFYFVHNHINDQQNILKTILKYIFTMI